MADVLVKCGYINIKNRTSKPDSQNGMRFPIPVSLPSTASHAFFALIIVRRICFFYRFANRPKTSISRSAGNPFFEDAGGLSMAGILPDHERRIGPDADAYQVYALGYGGYAAVVEVFIAQGYAECPAASVDLPSGGKAPVDVEIPVQA